MLTFWHVFQCFVFWRCNSLTFHLPWLSVIPKQLGYTYISQFRYQFCLFQQTLKSRKVTIFFKSTYFWSSRSQMFFKEGVLKSYAIFPGKYLRWSHFLIKFQSFRPATLKVTSMKVFYCDYCKIFKNIFFHRTPPVAASVTCERRSLFQDMTWLFLSKNLLRSKNTQGDFFDFKMLLTIFSLQEQSF